MVLAIVVLSTVLPFVASFEWTAGNSSGVSISVSSSGAYSVSYRGSLWFNSSSTALLVAGAMKSNLDGSLVLTSHSVVREASDPGFGSYTALNLNWSMSPGFSKRKQMPPLASNPAVIWSTTFKAYED